MIKVLSKGKREKQKPQIKGWSDTMSQHARPPDQRARFRLVFPINLWGAKKSHCPDSGKEFCRGEHHPPSGPNTDIIECGLTHMEKVRIKVLRAGSERQPGHAKNNIPFTNAMTHQKDHSEMTTQSPK